VFQELQPLLIVSNPVRPAGTQPAAAVLSKKALVLNQRACWELLHQCSLLPPTPYSFFGSEYRKTLQQKTDSQGAAYFYLQPPLPSGVSADANSILYHAIHADPEFNVLPQEVTIPVRHLSFMESLHLIFVGVIFVGD
jgi:hypothetical protein